MRRRWAVILPAIGLVLFAIVTYQSIPCWKPDCLQCRYVWWSVIPLDSDPLYQHTSPCVNGKGNCCFDPQSFWLREGQISRILTVSAFPAFMIGMMFVHSLDRFGVSEVKSFMAVMPVLIAAWYYLVGWLIDRWMYRRASRAVPGTS